MSNIEQLEQPQLPRVFKEVALDILQDAINNTVDGRNPVPVDVYFLFHTASYVSTQFRCIIYNVYIYMKHQGNHILLVPKKKALSFTHFFGESEPLLWGFR